MGSGRKKEVRKKIREKPSDVETVVRIMFKDPPTQVPLSRDNNGERDRTMDCVWPHKPRQRREVNGSVAGGFCDSSVDKTKKRGPRRPLIQQNFQKRNLLS